MLGLMRRFSACRFFAIGIAGVRGLCVWAEVGSGSGGVQGVALDWPVEAAWELCSYWTHGQRWWPGNLKCELREGENRKPSCLRVQLMPGVCNYERLLECEDGKRFSSGCRALSTKPR